MSTVGFDFGTTNSLLSIVSSGRVISFLEDDNLPIPSVVCYEGGKVIVGKEARLRAAGAGLGVKGNLVRSPKTLLDRGDVDVEGVQRRPIDIVAEVVKHVMDRARSGPRGRDLGDIRDAVVTIPVTMDGRRRAALRDAFRIAGLRIKQFVHEPLAALYGHLRSLGPVEDVVRQYDRQLLLVVDWGGGTLDITLCRMVDGTLFQLANDGSDLVGGDVFDDAIRNEVLDRTAGRRAGVDLLISADARTRLLHKCEEAKIALSSKDRIKIYLPGVFHGETDDDLDETLRRDELERIIRPILDQGFARIVSLLDRAGVAPGQVAMCLAVGGMANMPAITAHLHEWFGVPRVHVSRRSASLISEGAAWIAADGSPLRLAKNVEVVLARGSRLTVIRAGLEMPLEGDVKREELQLYCVDPRDGFAKIQLEAPVRPGVTPQRGDQRVSLCTFELKVDPMAKPFQERLNMVVAINDDLILEARARSLNQGGQSGGEVHDLEFSIRLPQANAQEQVSSPDAAESSGSRHQCGDVTFRANLADSHDDHLVPGELLYQYKPEYFDVRNRPPEIQEKEKLYYQPCSICGRQSNHPDCRCASQLRPTLN